MKSIEQSFGSISGQHNNKAILEQLANSFKNPDFNNIKDIPINLFATQNNITTTSTNSVITSTERAVSTTINSKRSSSLQKNPEDITKFNKIDNILGILEYKNNQTPELRLLDGISITNVAIKWKTIEYVCIYLPKISKTIMVSNSYAQATFILNGEINLDSNISKDEIKSKQGTITIENDDTTLWKEIAYDAIFGTNYSQKTYKLELIKNIKKEKEKSSFSGTSIDYLLSIKVKDIDNVLTAFGKKITYIANSIFDFQEEKRTRIQHDKKMMVTFLIENIYNSDEYRSEQNELKSWLEKEKKLEDFLKTKDILNKIKKQLPENPPIGISIDERKKIEFKIDNISLNLCDLAKIVNLGKILGKQFSFNIETNFHYLLLLKIIYGDIYSNLNEAYNKEKYKTEAKLWSKEKWIEELKKQYPLRELLQKQLANYKGTKDFEFPKNSGIKIKYILTKLGIERGKKTLNKLEEDILEKMLNEIYGIENLEN